MPPLERVKVTVVLPVPAAAVTPVWLVKPLMVATKSETVEALPELRLIATPFTDNVRNRPCPMQ